MKFNDVRLDKLFESEIGVFYKGLTHNFYDLKEFSLSKKEKSFALFLENLIQRSFYNINHLLIKGFSTPRYLQIMRMVYLAKHLFLRVSSTNFKYFRYSGEMS